MPSTTTIARCLSALLGGALIGGQLLCPCSLQAAGSGRSSAPALWRFAMPMDRSYTEDMTKADLTRQALELPIDEQLEIAQTLWEHASPPVDSTLTPELQELLEARYREANANPEAGISWEEMKARLLRRT